MKKIVPSFLFPFIRKANSFVKLCLLLLPCLLGRQTSFAQCQTWQSIYYDFESPTADGKVSFAISGAVPYVAGNFMSGLFVQRYVGSVWQTISTTAPIGSVSGRTSLAIGPDGRPYVAYADAVSHGIVIVKYNDVSWVQIGSTIPNTGTTGCVADAPSLAFNSSGVPYVAYSNCGCKVRKLVGSDWVVVGDVVDADGYQPGLAISSAGIPYVICYSGAAVKIWKYNGTVWTTVGSSLPMPSAGTNYGEWLEIAVDAAGTVYTGGNLPIAKFDGSDWVYIEGITTGGLAGGDLAFSPSGELYVTNGQDRKIQKYSGSEWLVVGNAGYFVDGIMDITGTPIAFNSSGIPYIAYGYHGSGTFDNGILVAKLDNGVPAITGDSLGCPGVQADLYIKSFGGVWSSSNTAVATPFTTADLWHKAIHGIAAGTATLTYAYGTGCSATRTVTISPVPSIAGAMSVGIGAHTTMSNTLSGGYWTSGNTAVLTIGSGTGITTGITAGTSLVSYNTSAFCFASAIVTVSPLLTGGITGTTSICPGATSTLSHSSSGGTWSSSNTAVATIDASSGVVSALTPGTSVIVYTTSSGIASTTVTVIAPPDPGVISGASSICLGATAAFSNTATSGSWSSGTPTIASISGSGVVSALAVGSAIISYTKTNSCGASYATKPVTIVSSPTAISGASAVCVGNTITQTNSMTGGSWSGSTTVASISSAGVVTGLSAGSVVISYSIGASCVTTKVITVSAPGSVFVTPDTITICPGSTVTLSASYPSATSYTWTGIGSATGISCTSCAVTNVTPVVSGANQYKVTATNAVGCSVSRIATVNVLPATSAGTISGVSSVCVTGLLLLSNAVSGGTWSSGNPSIATITSGGLVTGVSGGTVTISYTVTGCGTVSATKIVTVLPMPVSGPISGATVVCAGSLISLSSATTGGTWSSSIPGIATVNSSGVVTGVAVGSAIISYTTTNVCGTAIDTQLVTVVPNSNPGTISGSASLCAGATITLYDATTGGSWSSSNTSRATINTAGIVTGVSGGTVTISYTVSNSCGTGVATKLITVNPLPVSGTIIGSFSVCIGGHVTLASTVTGGSWSSGTTSVALINGTGVVTGVAAGTTMITYMVTNSCGSAWDTAIVTVSPSTVAGPLSGTSTVCMGATTSLSSTISGGSWTSSNVAIATVSSSGVVTGIASGTARITYSVTGTCGTATTSMVVTVNPLPFAGTITGIQYMCAGAGVTLTNTTGGGSWSSSNTSVATVTSGVVTSLVAGTSIISYSVSNSCGTATDTALITVNPVPGAISGNSPLCIGTSISLSNTLAGGSWTSTASTVASVGSGTGIITALAAGNTTISYIMPTGCKTSTVVTVNPLPAAITGTMVVCAGLNTTLADALTGGSWTSSNTAVATISTSGVVSGISAGTSVISYTFSTGCARSAIVTINTSVPAITGSFGNCIGTVTTLTNSLAGGSWSTSNPGVAGITATSGILTCSAAGTANITYTLGSGCRNTTNVTVYALPANITGTANVCIGSMITLSDASLGGSWTSGSPAIASVSGGVVLGVGAGTATITYTLATGCLTTKVITVNPLPTSIVGVLDLCAGTVTTLSDFTTPGVSWTSGNTAVATVNTSTGVVTGIAGGTAEITYTVSTGCKTSAIVTVYPTPAAITGTLKACVGATTTLANTMSGGSWTSATPAIATISATGVVTGVAPGITPITYMMPEGCYRTTSVTINANPAPITGAGTVCVGFTTTLSSATTSGGTWTSSNTSVATISPTTLAVTGITPGNTTISYVLTTGCHATFPMTVNTLVTPITGSLTLCAGDIGTLANTTSGGTWSSSNAGVAVIGSSSGVVSGIGAGTATITYTAGCRTMSVITIVAQPAVITGTAKACVGLSTTLSDATAGGSWFSDDPFVASINSAGILTGVSAGTTTISYVIGSSGCSRSVIATINPLPAPIGGALNVCVGSATSLSTTSTGGTWASSSTGVATIISSTGVATGVTAGTSTITYRITATGCITTDILTVNALPPVITGTLKACPGTTTTLSDSVSGGSWASSNTAIADVDAFSGVVTGITPGMVNISYTAPTGCVRTAQVTINPLPAAITGTLTVCEGQTTIVGNTASGGAWTSSDTTIATINTTTRIVTGINAGTVDITYTLATGCFITAVVTVNPAAPTIAGIRTVCVGQITSLSNIDPGGTWSSLYTAVATINATSGIVTGVASGTTTISYGTTSGCTATVIVTVYALPSAITGSAALCVGSTSTLGDPVAGGSWSVDDVSIATISAAGVVTGMSFGTTVVTYTLGTGCQATRIITVNDIPGAIIGTTDICVGTTTTLTSSTTGGVWSSTATSVISIGASNGVAVGLAAGSATVTYTLPTGCRTFILVSVGVTPAAITGSLTTCVGLTSSLADATTGGIWSSSDAFVANIGSSTGVVTGVASGTATISYMSGMGCYRTAVVTVNANPSAILGNTNICAGATSVLSDLTPGGLSWTSSNTSVATVATLSGFLTGVAAGTTNITYTLSSGCYTITEVTVNALPQPVSGTLKVCTGSTTSLSDADAGGTWTSANTAIATIGVVDGVASGLVAGTTTISYSLGLAGCVRTAILTVNPTPAAIAGYMVVCPGSTTPLTNGSGAGTWTSSATGIATVSAGGGVVTGVSAGTATITFNMPTGCFATSTVTVNPAIPASTGTFSVCMGSTTTLSNSISGGSWSSSNNAIASVNAATGVVTGMANGTVNISYTFGAGCFTSTVITVKALPSAITGTAVLCESGSVTLANATTGGSWSSANSSVAVIGSSNGIVSGVSAGTATISYVSAAGCGVATVVTVNPRAPIAGLAALCEGQSTTLTNSNAGGTWSSSIPSVATISASGVLTSLSAGLSVISYALPTGCMSTLFVTVNPLPSAITGMAIICGGSSVTLSSASSGGSWSSSNTSVADVDMSTGVVTGMSAGTATISYVLSTGCAASRIVTVDTAPAAIAGTMSVCTGLTTTLSDATAGGTWSIANASIATISAAGVVTGFAVGTTNVSYTLPSGCVITTMITVLPSPAVIAGPAHVCVSSSVALSNAVSGGTWSSSNTSVATVDVLTGVVIGLSAGTTAISYTLPAGCMATLILTVDALPAIIGGPSSVCVSSSITLTNSVSGGTWSSSNPAIATVGLTDGVVNGLAAGSVFVTYTTGAGCVATGAVTINPISPVTGQAGLCIAAATTLANATAGGTWSSSNTSVAVVGSLSGIVSGVANGTSTVVYTMPTGCIASIEITVNPTPASITGTLALCVGVSSTLSNATSGGTWSSSAPVIATVGLSSGVVTGLALGNTIITYSLGAGCKSMATITVNPQPSAISGTLVVCPGTTTTLNNSIPGGTWVSLDPSVATVNTATRVVTGVSGGTATISYYLATGCSVTTIVTVNPAPDPITGTLAVCPGNVTALTGLPSGGTWSSSNPTLGTVDASGNVSGLAAGTFNVTYTLATGCTARATVTVNPLPAAISGTALVCAGVSATLGNATTGGAWSSSDLSVATISGSGVVTSIAAGTTTVSYTLSTGCARSITFSVNPLPGAITGTLGACIGNATTLTGSGGGVWSSSATSVVSIGSASGIITGLSAGTANVTYTLTTGCKTISVVTISPTPAAITGTTKACPGTSTTLADATTGGTWSSSNTSVAVVGVSSGVVTGVSAGIVAISYFSAAGCRTTTNVTINPAPAPIAGTLSACIGTTTALTDPTTGGLSWTSSTPSVATVGASSGIVTGIGAGTTNITYTLGTGCVAIATVTINPLPATVSGVLKVCAGKTTSLSDADAGGTWTSGNSLVATIGSSDGVVTAVASGTTVVSYTLPTGCRRTAIVTVNASPLSITGYGTACIGTNITLADATGGGTWVSNATGVATVTSAGVVTGVSAGTAGITYTVTSTGCNATTVVTVIPVPSASTGTLTACIGSTTTLSNATPGGTWSSANNAIASIGSATGIATGIGTGTVNITYSFGTGCRTVSVFTGNPLPAFITGSPMICPGGVTTLLDATAGGTWSTADAAIATIGGTGIVTGVAAGTVNMTYTIPTGCLRTLVVTVNASPDAGTISGPTSIVIATTPTITLTSTGTPGGLWASSNTSVATVDGSGNVTGVSAGMAVISYTVFTGCGSATATYTVNVAASRSGGIAQSATDDISVTHLGVYPNPAKNTFIVKGTLASDADQQVTVEITDLPGQVIYINSFAVSGGKMEQSISLPSATANGMYIVTIHTVKGTAMCHLVIQQ